MTTIELTDDEIQLLLEFLPASYRKDTPKEVKELRSKLTGEL